MDLAPDDKVVVIDESSSFYGWYAQVDRIAEEDCEEGNVLVEFLYQDNWPPEEYNGAKCVVRFERIALGRMC